MMHGEAIRQEGVGGKKARGRGKDFLRKKSFPLPLALPLSYPKNFYIF
jgi:hypothetical protein